MQTIEPCSSLGRHDEWTAQSAKQGKIRLLDYCSCDDTISYPLRHGNNGMPATAEAFENERMGRAIPAISISGMIWDPPARHSIDRDERQTFEER